jgi:hypothetical protein
MAFFWTGALAAGIMADRIKIFLASRPREFYGFSN